MANRNSEVTNSAETATSSTAAAERPQNAAERPAMDGGGPDRPNIVVTLAGPREFDAGNEGTQLLRRFAVGLILFFWVAQTSALTLVRFIRYPEETTESLVPRAMVALCGIGISFAILAVQRRSRASSFKRRLALAVGLAIAGATLHSILNYVIFSTYFWSFGLNVGWYLMAILDWVWVYTSLSILLLVVTYGADLADSQEQIAALQARAGAAQLRALRYQLNPHFLFNTLNAIASLISRRENGRAETMVVSLSDFLRSTLKIDAGVEITLGDEIALQALYLDIERARFPHRLQVTIDVPDGLRDALVPNLILQPLVENAIKHGVARSSKRVHVELIGRASGDRLELQLRDDGGDAPAATPSGASVGLRNVAERLALHFGDAARFVAEPRPGGGFCALIEMPLKRAP